MTSVSKNHFTVRLNDIAIGMMRKSGESPSHWLRQAVQLRLENEQQATTTVNKVDNEIASLKQKVTDNQQGILRLQQSDAVMQAILADMQKGLGVLEKNQHVLHEMLIDLSQSMRQQFQALGTSLLTDLREQLQDLAKAQEEPELFKVQKAPPRTRL